MHSVDLPEPVLQEVVAWPNTSSNSACSRIGSASSSESSTDSTFFNRTDEVKALNLLFEDPAAGICVITGPRNAGKTALLKHLMDDRGL
jgi:type II secretory ATPase GspE/PulE/Tfp pilus assembly ATPase PilB-like protein